MAATHQDTLNKVIGVYFASVTNEPFTYKGKEFQPRDAQLSPLILRDYTCPPGCGGCCLRFTLDYLPIEPHPPSAVPRMVPFNGRDVEVLTDAQEGNEDRFCKNLNKEDGRCGIYEVRPFSCDFELIRFLQSTTGTRPDVLTQKLFGRGWALTRIDGVKGAKCEMTPVTEHSINETLRKLLRLKQWTDFFGLQKTKLPEIIHWVEAAKIRFRIEAVEAANGVRQVPDNFLTKLKPLHLPAPKA